MGLQSPHIYIIPLIAVLLRVETTGGHGGIDDGCLDAIDAAYARGYGVGDCHEMVRLRRRPAVPPTQVRSQQCVKAAHRPGHLSAVRGRCHAPEKARRRVTVTDVQGVWAAWNAFGGETGR